MSSKTKRQDIISTFLFNVWLYSDSDELDEWMAYLARENEDDELADLFEREYTKAGQF